MSGTKSSSRLASVKKDGSFRYATRFLALEKGKRNNSNKETNSSKSCDCIMKSDNWKGSKNSQNSKLPVKKSNSKCCTTKESRKKGNTNHREKVVIVSKRSSSVSVVKSCNLRKSVSVKKVSYSTSVVLSSDEDTDSDEESEDEEEEKKSCSRKKRTVVKHTTSKVKSSVRESKTTENRAAKKAKAIKLLCDKLSASNKGGKDIDTSRELRPRFPYNMLQEWPTARTHRMASLNALAKVHVLYENEGRTVGENLNDADESSLIDFLNENSDMDDDDDSDDEDHIEVKKETKPAINANVKRNDKSKLNDVDKSKTNDSKSKSNDNSKSKSNDNSKSKSNDGNKPKCNDKDKLKNGKKDKLQAKVKVQRRGKKRKAPDVEIIDTRICKRMASLNAQAILAASYLQEPKPKRVYKKSEKCDSEFDEKEIVLESKCDIKVIKTEKEDDVTFIETKQIKRNDKHNEIFRNSSKERTSKNSDPAITHKKQASENQRSETPKQKKHPKEPELTIIESNASDVVSSSRKCSVANSVVSSSAATTKVGVTQYTEVTKVQINTHKDAEIKTDSKSERKIEQIVTNDDVAITQMYHYQSKSTNESYCVQMQTTYKPGSRNLSPSASRPPGEGLHPFVNEPLMPSNQHYYNHNPMLPPHTYQMNPNMGPVPPAIGMDHRIPRQFGGSAFTVPHYRHPQPMQFPPNEYGYYQPAGPLIQPVQDQYTIHKPVPYHPQPNPHQPPQRPQQPSSQREGFPTAFESHQSHPQKPSLPSHPSKISPQQKPLTSTGPPSSESHPQSSSSSQFTRRQPGDDSRTRSLSRTGNSASFSHPPKHVRSPVMPTLHSSQQNFRNYQPQKRVPSTYRNYNLPYEHKEDPASKHRGYDTGSSFNAPHSNASAKGAPRDSHLPRNTSSQSKEVLSREPHASPMHSRNASRSGEHYKNMNNPDNSKQRCYGFKNGTSSSNPYHSGPSSSMHHSSMNQHGNAPLGMHHPNASSISHPSTSNVQHSNSSSEMCNPGPYSNVCNTDPSSSMYGPPNMHHSDSSSTFMPYHNNGGKDIHHRNMPDPVEYPSRPPSVIEIVEDNHRDTKTYIQLEVPKNSHREKIVVVDVEDDDIEKKQVLAKTSDKGKSSFDKPEKKDEPEKKCALSKNDIAKQNVESSQNKVTAAEAPVKIEKIEKVSEKSTESKKVNPENAATSSTSDTPLPEKVEKPKTEPPDVMVLEVKKKKESAVVRRARLHGKQRTFRDCYNRPLAPLSKTKKSEDVSSVAEKHLAKNFQPLVSLPRLVLPKIEKPPAHGWSWEGTPCDKQVYVSNDDPPLIRRCYPSMRHAEGDIICVKDCVFLRSGSRKTDLPFVAKVTALWNNPADGEMNMSLLWYYRPEHTETGKKLPQVDDEVFASKHRDTNSVACIEDKCFVLTYAEYCRYKKRCKMLEDGSIPDFSAVPQGEEYPRKNRLPPPNVFPDLVLFCRKVYDYRQKRLLKNPV